MKDKIIVFGFIGILITFFTISLLDKDTPISKAERRTLAESPSFSISSLLNGTFLSSLDTYLVDQFPFRDSFRKEKNIFSTIVYQKKENQGAFVKENRIYELDFQQNENSILYFTKKLNSIQKEYFPNRKVYYSIIPDKNYYVNASIFPKLDYKQFYEQIRNHLDSHFYEIDLRKDLNLDSYYRTDLHWRQEALEPVLKTIQKEMNLDFSLFPSTQKSFFPFYGAYYSKSPFTIKPDTITYLTSDTIKNTTVYNYEKKVDTCVYPEENLFHIDSYDVFLDGASALLILENKMSKNNRTLLLFRDSFASSLAPLLLENYNKIILIDLRYFSSTLLPTIKDIDLNEEKQDVLFLYSVPIVNKSFSLK